MRNIAAPEVLAQITGQANKKTKHTGLTLSGSYMGHLTSPTINLKDLSHKRFFTFLMKCQYPKCRVRPFFKEEEKRDKTDFIIKRY